MKYQIKATCKDCDFKGNFDEVFNHCKKTKHGDYGNPNWSSSESGRNRCNMTLDKNDIVRAIIQPSLKELLDDMLDYNKSTYKNILEYLMDMWACERLPHQIEGHDIDDVIGDFKSSEFTDKLKAMLLSTHWVDDDINKITATSSEKDQ